MSHRKKYLLCVTGGACLGYYSIFVHCRRGSGKKTVMMKRTMTIANILQTVTPKTRTRTPAIILHKELFLFGGHANLQSVLRHIQGEINAVEAYFYITEEEELWRRRRGRWQQHKKEKENSEETETCSQYFGYILMINVVNYYFLVAEEEAVWRQPGRRQPGRRQQQRPTNGRKTTRQQQDQRMLRADFIHGHS